MQNNIKPWKPTKIVVLKPPSSKDDPKKIIDKKKSKVKVKNLPATESSPVRKEKIKSIKSSSNSPKTRRPKLDEPAPPTLVETGSKGSRKTTIKTSSSSPNREPGRFANKSKNKRK